MSAGAGPGGAAAARQAKNGGKSAIIENMTNEAKRLLEKAMESVGLRGSFDPAELGAKVGLSRQQAESAARDLSNAGVLVLGFDLAAHFTPDYRKAHAPPAAAKSKLKSKEALKGKDSAKGKDKGSKGNAVAAKDAAGKDIGGKVKAKKKRKV